MAINFGNVDAQKVFVNGGEILGVADVELPTIEMTTNEFQNSAIAGKINVSSTGSLEPMEATFNFQSVATEIKWMFNPGALSIVEIVSAMPTMNFQLPNISLSAQIVQLIGQFRSFDLATRRTGEINEPIQVMNVWSMVFLDNGVPVMTVDALNRNFPIDQNGVPIGLASALKNFI